MSEEKKRKKRDRIFNLDELLSATEQLEKLLEDDSDSSLEESLEKLSEIRTKVHEPSSSEDEEPVKKDSGWKRVESSGKKGKKEMGRKLGTARTRFKEPEQVKIVRKQLSDVTEELESVEEFKSIKKRMGDSYARFNLGKQYTYEGKSSVYATLFEEFNREVKTPSRKSIKLISSLITEGQFEKARFVVLSELAPCIEDFEKRNEKVLNPKKKPKKAEDNQLLEAIGEDLRKFNEAKDSLLHEIHNMQKAYIQSQKKLSKLEMALEEMASSGHVMDLDQEEAHQLGKVLSMMDGPSLRSFFSKKVPPRVLVQVFEDMPSSPLEAVVAENLVKALSTSTDENILYLCELNDLILSRQIAMADSDGTFLRGNNLAIKLLSLSNSETMACKAYKEDMVGEYFKGVGISAAELLEEFPEIKQGVEKGERNSLSLDENGPSYPMIEEICLQHASSILNKILKTHPSQMPFELLYTCGVLFREYPHTSFLKKGSKKREEILEAAYKKISGHLFIRIISPTINTPVPGLSDVENRIGVLVSMILQGVANNVHLKHSHQGRINKFIDVSYESLLEWLEMLIIHVYEEVFPLVKMEDTGSGKKESFSHKTPPPVKPLDPQAILDSISKTSEKFEFFWRSHSGLLEEFLEKEAYEDLEREYIRILKGMEPEIPHEEEIDLMELSDFHGDIKEEVRKFETLLAKHLKSKVKTKRTLEKNFRNLEAYLEVVLRLHELGYHLVNVLGDGNCLFYAVVEQLKELGIANIKDQDLREALATLLLHPSNKQALIDYIVEYRGDEAISAELLRLAKESGYIEEKHIRSLADKIIKDLKTPYKYDGIAGDLAPMLLPLVLNRNIRVISPNGGDVTYRPGDSPFVPVPAATLGGGGADLLIVYNGINHYMNAKPN